MAMQAVAASRVGSVRVGRSQHAKPRHAAAPTGCFVESPLHEVRRVWLLAVWQWAPEDDGGVQSCAGRLRFLTALLRCLGQVSTS